jgi:malyl-CoA/(S)-citramalyl-CoA lyase
VSVAARPERLARSLLSVPGARPELFAKAARSAADVVLLDLEDSVPPAAKDRARADVIAALRDIDWTGKTVAVRVNAWDTPWTWRDVGDVVGAAGAKLDLLMLPKANSAGDVVALERLVEQVERGAGLGPRIGFELQIETAAGLAAVEAIAAASARAEALHFGAGDFAASMGMPTTAIGAPVAGHAVRVGGVEHPADAWHYAQARIAVAARARGLRPIDGPYADFADAAGFESAARKAAALGFAGKWAIHPSQVAAANAIFAPAASEVAQARRVLAALEAAGREGRGAATLDGRMIDVASIRQARALLARADAIAARG